MDANKKQEVKEIPLLKTKAGPSDAQDWVTRLKEEYGALIKYIELNKARNNDWFNITSTEDGLNWSGKCWVYYNHQKYMVEFNFEIPALYPTVPPEIKVESLDGLTAKMYRGGAICLSDHFKPLWSRNIPRFGIAQAVALGLGPWIAVELPLLADKNLIQPTTEES
eukprot:Clim_evm66s156 gene=Clim_evmTU66s156